MANKPGEANFFPDVPEFPSMGVFQPIYGKFDLTTYIQGASDYEIMAFLVGKYNACLEAYGNITKLSTDTITACKQLQDWINSWFTNLDVQEEINKKIDSMVADGSFGTLLHQTFDTQINQQTTNAVTAWLVANVTPTGSAVIVDKSLSIEGAAADAKVTGLWLTGIGGINVTNYKQAGDSSDDYMFNRAFEDLTTKIIAANDYSGNYTLLIPSGIYTFKRPVLLSPLITYVTTGAVIINSYADTCFRSESDSIPEHFFANDKIDWMKKVWLNFNNCTIFNKGSSTATGISIGAPTYESGYKNVLAYYTIQGVNVNGFGEGFHFYPVNAFLFTLKDCFIGDNTNGIIFGDSEHSDNFGENICLNHCIFGGNQVGCQSRENSWLLNFNQCSFDFNRVGFSATGAGIFKFEECHFEQNNETQKGDGDYGPIRTNNDDYCVIIADKCTVLEHNNPSVLFTNTAPGTLSLSNMTFVTSFTNPLEKPLFYQCEHATSFSACDSYSFNFALPVNKHDSLIRGDMHEIVHSYDIPSFGIVTDNYNAWFKTAFDMSYNENLERRYLKITCTPTSTRNETAIPYVKFQKFKVSKKMLCNAIYKLNDTAQNVIFAINYYDSNNAKISTDEFHSTTTPNEYVTNVPAPCIFIPPSNAYTAEIEIRFHIPTSGSTPVSCELYYMWIK